MKNGYNRYEVDDALTQLNEDISEKDNIIRTTQKEHEELKLKYDELLAKYDSLMQSLEAKEKANEEMTRFAIKEANTIISTAKSNADLLIEDALAAARGILWEVSSLAQSTQAHKAGMYDEIGRIERALDAFQVVEIPNVDVLKDKE